MKFIIPVYFMWLFQETTGSLLQTPEWVSKPGYRGQSLNFRGTRISPNFAGAAIQLLAFCPKAYNSEGVKQDKIIARR
jgi:hypothetical protein